MLENRTKLVSFTKPHIFNERSSMSHRLILQNVRKSFGATAALRGVSLGVGEGEVHALIGENGAGKSTLMKILSGAHEADAGRIALDGAPFAPRNPHEARRAGVAMIYQELNLAPDLSVAENIVLGAEPSRLGWLRRGAMRDTARRALAELGHGDLSPDAPVRSLSIAEQQLVEIARALAGEPRVMIFDEPTSSLTQADAERLFAVIARLKARGVSVIYISHFLEECRRVCDRFTVLRDGESVGTGALAETPIAEIIRLMVGREVSELYPRIAHTMGEVVLKVEGLSSVAAVVRRRANQERRERKVETENEAACSEKFSEFSAQLSDQSARRLTTAATLEVRAGEIFGLFGLVGSGRTELLRRIFGLDAMGAERITIFGREETSASPPRRLAQGVGLLSENRKEEGLMLQRSLAENLTATRPVAHRGSGWLFRGRERRLTREWISKLSVRAREPEQAIGELSGGNQQKIALGRLLHHDAKILLLDEPTRGIDVGSKAQIYRLTGELAAQGKAVLFVSSYIPELLGVCDTIGVMCRGKLAAVRPAAEWTEHTLMEAAIGTI
jgi:ribose transport system ATP-binding protein